jgi:phenylalanyl-tRNA synthetase beta chain
LRRKGWLVTPPAHRFDISIEADLIEELARIVGFESIVESDALTRQKARALPEAAPVETQVLEILATRGYQEAITYAFVDPVLQGKLFPGVSTPTLSNPIASDMAVMRASLWPGLINAARENQRRQQDRIRLFEHGARFGTGGAETDLLAGIAIGARRPEQWGAKATPVDFFDVKQDLDALFAPLRLPAIGGHGAEIRLSGNEATRMRHARATGQFLPCPSCARRSPSGHSSSVALK